MTATLANAGAAISTTEAFRQAIATAGLEPPDLIVPDGQIHRFVSDRRKGDAAGWYVLFLSGVPAGAFGCHRAGFLAPGARRSAAI